MQDAFPSWGRSETSPGFLPSLLLTRKRSLIFFAREDRFSGIGVTSLRFLLGTVNRGKPPHVSTCMIDFRNSEIITAGLSASLSCVSLDSDHVCGCHRRPSLRHCFHATKHPHLRHKGTCEANVSKYKDSSNLKSSSLSPTVTCLLQEFSPKLLRINSIRIMFLISWDFNSVTSIILMYSQQRR